LFKLCITLLNLFKCLLLFNLCFYLLSKCLKYLYLMYITLCYLYNINFMFILFRWLLFIWYLMLNL